MKSSNQHIVEYLIINKDYRDNVITVKSFDELRNIIEDRYDKLGPGTEQNPIDFNDIDVSNIDSFCDNNGILYKGIFAETKFKYIDISDWDVSNIKSMRGMFGDSRELESVGDLSSWDVSNVIDMSFMFCDCCSFNQNISDWDVSNVTNMSSMFYYCKKFNQDLSRWDVLNVTNKLGIFYRSGIKNEYKPKFK